MNIRKVLGCSIIGLAALTASFAISVDQPEIESAGGANTVVFRNYTGPHTVINSAAEIKAIGAGLGRNVSSSVDSSAEFGSANRYQIIHVVDPSAKDKLDADIFIIGSGATVDHIDNVRRILSGYLESAYGYSTRDADTLAVFVTVYNAVYRGNLNYFQSKYKDAVTRNLTSTAAGIDTDYQQWPGKTQLVIPLSDLSGGLSTVDTSIISDRNVVKSMQEDDDKNIDARKDMVDIKEREADNAQNQANQAQQKATDENAKLKEEQNKSSQANREAQAAQKEADNAQKQADSAQKKADNAQKQADSAQKQADEANKKAQENPDNKQAQQQAEQAQKKADDAQKKADDAKSQADAAQQKADDAQKQADDKQQAATEQNKKTEEQAQKASDASKEAETAQDKADTKRSEAQNERAEIAKDQQTLIREASQNENANVVYGLKNVDDLGQTSEIIKMNSDNGAVIKESPVTVIRGRTVYEDGDNFVAVAGTNFGNGAVKLVLLDKENLEIAAESAETLSELSVLIEDKGDYYCTVQNGRNFYVAKYNSKLEKLIQSPVAVKAATPITVTAKGILVCASSGNPAILSLDKLTLIGEGTSTKSNKAANVINSAANLANDVNNAANTK